MHVIMHVKNVHLNNNENNTRTYYRIVFLTLMKQFNLFLLSAENCPNFPLT